ncbi:MAG: hypothetical protein PHH59_07625 [Methylovulum sp.]|uniref:hypothetical protein n=1 Tax=Methylovulum sp. TaxID=1916980 RepID=UPI002621CF8D|nr:hypothetical protein [Methylovulum sp.]MDD2723875.1 hypothetical protein [Methylovulum sp.]
MINSKVIRDNRRHITRADYNDTKPLLGSEHVLFPKVCSLQARALRRMLPTGLTLSHREFDFASHSYRLGSFIDQLRDKGWTIVNHDQVALTKDTCKRTAKFTRYELFAEFTPELAERIAAFCKAVDDFEARAAATAQAKGAKQ